MFSKPNIESPSGNVRESNFDSAPFGSISLELVQVVM